MCDSLVRDSSVTYGQMHQIRNMYAQTVESLINRMFTVFNFKQIQFLKMLSQELNTFIINVLAVTYFKSWKITGVDNNVSIPTWKSCPRLRTFRFGIGTLNSLCNTLKPTGLITLKRLRRVREAAIIWATLHSCWLRNSKEWVLNLLFCGFSSDINTLVIPRSTRLGAIIFISAVSLISSSHSFHIDTW